MKKTILTIIMAVAGLTGVSAQTTTITFYDTRDLTSKINTEAEKGGLRKVRFSDRAVNGGIWNVLVLPFDTDVATVSEAFGYAAVDMLNEDVSSGNIHFTTVTGNIPANTPFLVKPTTNPRTCKTNFTQVMFSNVTLKPVTAKVEVSDKAGNKFVGTYAPTTFYGNGYWYMSKGMWYSCSSKYTAEKPVQLKAFRAYVDFRDNVATSAPIIFIDEEDGTTTAIDPATFNRGEFSTDGTQDDGWYTMTGMRLADEPTAKGVYIHNARKVVIK